MPRQLLHDEIIYPDFAMDLSFDSETLQLEDIIQDYGMDPYVDPQIFQLEPAAQTPLLQSPSAMSATALPSPSVSYKEDAYVGGKDGTMSPISDTFFDAMKKDLPAQEKSSCTERRSSSTSEACLPFPSNIFTPAIRVIHRVRLAVSPPGPDEQAIFYIEYPSSPTTDHLGDEMRDEEVSSP